MLSAPANDCSGAVESVVYLVELFGGMEIHVRHVTGVGVRGQESTPARRLGWGSMGINGDQWGSMGSATVRVTTPCPSADGHDLASRSPLTWEGGGFGSATPSGGGGRALLKSQYGESAGSTREGIGIQCHCHPLPTWPEACPSSRAPYGRLQGRPGVRGRRFCFSSLTVAR